MSVQQRTGLQAAALSLAIGFALAPVMLMAQDIDAQGARVTQAMDVIEQSSPEGGLTAMKNGPKIGFSESFMRFVTRHEFWKPKREGLERGEAPLWKQDDIMGLVRDRPARARTGPKLGTFYDAQGRLRLYKPSPPPRGRVAILSLDAVDWFKPFAKKNVNWLEEKEKALKSLPPKYRNDLVPRFEQHMKEFNASREVYRSVRQIIRAAAKTPPATSDAVAKPVYPPDCNYDDAVLAQVTERLLNEQGNPSRLASLTAHFKEQEDIVSLRNCICRVHSGKSTTVSVFYQNEPHGGSPGCEDPANGPCVGAGFGCGRSKFVPDRAALEACGAARVISKAVCEKQTGVRK
ncbi:hypothetical protein RXV86_14205 [Alisedimentitalea sp. MJ-SS2]|uniref:hypothetical protein n=1 Tax=Aliisedimentitalea sp. MJ-SS2 TaxID=3049795 RepID=UPI0029072D3B|nr:hypothetical protein [Alisedimentitalea sp. MJ-SS2]MDU8928540.1 hypothetical protein [Alisedimentitalea sp. MJ-SS2]